MSEIITTAKTVEEAIEEGCRALGVSRDEVTYEIIEVEQRRLFRSTPAKVLVRRREEEFSIQDLLAGFGDKPAEKKAEPKPEKKQEKPAEKKAEKPAEKAAEKAAEKETEKPAEETAAEGEQKPKQHKKKKKKKPAEKKPVQVEAAAEGEDAAEDLSADEPEVLEPITEAELPARAVFAYAYLRDIAKALGAEKVDYAFARTERGVRFILSGEDAPSLIGRRGDTMDSIQYLCTVASSRVEGEYCRITLDIEGYRARREQSLQELAAKMAAKVKKNRYSQTLEPMNPYERRIVHAAIQKIEGVTSHSVGSEPHRKVVISLEGGSPDRKGRGGRRGRGGKGGNDRRREGGERRENRESTVSTEAPRVPKMPTRDIPVRKELKSKEEFIGTLYGKIEL